MNGRGGGPQTCFGGVEGTFRRACPCVKALLFTTARAAPRETPPWYARLQGEGHIRPLLCPSPGSPSGPRQRDLGPWCPAAARGARRGLTSPYYAPAVRNAVPLAPRPAKALRRHARPSRKGHNRGLLGRLLPCASRGCFSRTTTGAEAVVSPRRDSPAAPHAPGARIAPRAAQHGGPFQSDDDGVAVPFPFPRPDSRQVSWFCGMRLRDAPLWTGSPCAELRVAV